MRPSHSLHPLGAAAPAAQFARIARTIPAPRRLALAAAESANALSLALQDHADALNAVARRTLGASGFGDAHLAPDATLGPLLSDALQAAARADRARRIGDLVVALLRAVRTKVDDWRARYRHQVDAHSIYRELAGLDSRTLRDLGIHHRAELPFIAQRLAHGEDLREQRGQR